MTSSPTPVSSLIRPTRRNVLKAGGLGCAAGVVGVAALATSAQAASPIKQKAASYQPTPKGKQRCDNCRQWVAPAACKIVEGTIAPEGWCILYAPK